jgi:hypothetical protein
MPASRTRRCQSNLDLLVLSLGHHQDGNQRLGAAPREIAKILVEQTSVVSIWK